MKAIKKFCILFTISSCLYTVRSEETSGEIEAAEPPTAKGKMPTFADEEEMKAKDDALKH